MYKLRRRIIAFRLGRRKSLNRAIIYMRLRPFIELHDILFDMEEIHFHDINMGVFMKLEGYKPVNRIAFVSIVEMTDEYDGHCLKIVLRTGQYHLLDRYTPYRSHKYVFDDPKKPGKFELWLWGIRRKIKNKLHKKDIRIQSNIINN